MLDTSQHTENKHTEVGKQTNIHVDIVKNYFKVLEIISSLNF